jgi:hypothetical protein
MRSPYIVAWNKNLQQTTTLDKVILLYHNRHQSSYCIALRDHVKEGYALVRLVVYFVDHYFFPDTNILCRITSLLYPSCIYTLNRNCTSYSEGDKICLFGFSRGGRYSKLMPNLLSDAFKAYTARAVMGMLYKVVCHHLA